MSPHAKSQIFRNLSRYVRTGMGIEKACESLLSQPGVGAAERRLYGAIGEGVSSGQSIAEAMAAHSDLNRLDFHLLDASEKGGRLDAGLIHLADYYERTARTRRRIRRGLLYPVVLFHLALVVTTFTNAMFVRFNPNTGPMSLPEAMWKTSGWVLYLYLTLVLVALIFLTLRNLARRLPGVDRVLNRVPLFGKVRKFAALERFSSVFEISLLSGMRMDRSFEASGLASESSLIREAAGRGADSAREGRAIAETFFSHRAAFPNDFARGVAAGEESGMLDVEFGRWKEYYSHALSEAMDRLAEWSPKLVYFVTIFVVAWMIIRVGLSYRALLDGIMNF